MENLLTFNLRVPVGVQVVSHLVSENTILEQFMLVLSSSISGCKFDKYRKEIEDFTSGPLHGIGGVELKGALAVFAGRIADQILSDFVPELSIILGKGLPPPRVGVIDEIGNASTVPSSATSEPPAEPEPEPEPPAPEDETKNHLKEFASKNLAGFDQFTEEKIDQIISQASTNIQAIAAKSGIPEEQVSKAAQLAFYDFTILYDDSGSMKSEESRISTTKQTVECLYKAAKVLNPDNKFAIRSFEGTEYENITSETELEDLVSSMEFNTGAVVAGPLKDRILGPLSEAATQKTLNPTAVIIVTDGDLGSTVPEFSTTLTDLKTKLDAAGNTGPAVLFLLCRVGNDESAAQSLEELNTDEKIKNLLFYDEESIDGKLAEVGGDIDAYVGAIISDLIKAMDLQAVA
ncbi:hypothetical protein AJ80_06014 [Polytolypa hystricis UAMH7299]|uniref:VWFA domain-containing protein n=1 Tax=Polytolypa hystricis (strain UAMH7299) TaxID=1447883 RepID=A0A2B7Y092_POLH7|nr:hypothetical protein AJ80_06014 [Polytolypa hystricis UAMH7299]